MRYTCGLYGTIRFKQNADSVAEVWLDNGQENIEVSDVLSGISIIRRPGSSVTDVELTVAATRVDVEVEDARIELDPRTRMMLHHLGWTAPS